MHSRSPNPQSGIGVFIIFLYTSAAAAALGALVPVASQAKLTAQRMARHAELAPMATELANLADEADALAKSAQAQADGGTPYMSHGPTLGLIILAVIDQRGAALEQEMLAAMARVDAAARADLAEGLALLRALRAQAAEARQELLILVTPTIVVESESKQDGFGVQLRFTPRIPVDGASKVNMPDQGSILIGG